MFYIYEKCAKPHPSSSRSQIFLTLLSDKRNCKQLLERKQGSLGVLLRSLAKNLGYLKISLNVIRVKAGKVSHNKNYLKTRRGSQHFQKAQKYGSLKRVCECFKGLAEKYLQPKERNVIEMRILSATACGHRKSLSMTKCTNGALLR